ncbi:hypothetical protein GCM10028820_32880 [Tessaracoccus terricola]
MLPDHWLEAVEDLLDGLVELGLPGVPGHDRLVNALQPLFHSSPQILALFNKQADPSFPAPDLPIR